MVYFEISKLGFDCGYEKSQCRGFPNNCSQCIKKRLNELGFVTNRIRIIDMDSQEKQLQLAKDKIWQKFVDVLNLRSIVLMDKESGLGFLNIAVTGKQIDPGLLSGFIQANIIFSQSGELTDSKQKFTYRQFYEFQYQDFNILLIDGTFARICLILSKKASKGLRDSLSTFQINFENKFRDELIQMNEAGQLLNQNKIIDFINHAFNLELTFPMELTTNIPPYEMDEINANPVQKAILDISKTILKKKEYFVVYEMLEKLKNTIDIDTKIILYEIHQFIMRKIFIPTTIEETEDKIRMKKQIEAKKIEENKTISSIISTENAMDELKERVKGISEKEARIIMESFIKKGERAEKMSIFLESQKEYEKALYVAKEFQFKNDIGKISFMIIELDRRNKLIDLDYEIQAGDIAEKNKDYIKSIEHYKKALGIIADFFSHNEAKKKLVKKLNKKIQKMQNILQ